MMRMRSSWRGGVRAGIVCMGLCLFLGVPLDAGAESVSGNSYSDESPKSGNGYINDSQRAAADAEMLRYKESLIYQKHPEQYVQDELGDILYSGIYYIANAETMTESEMWSFVGEIKSRMDSAVSKSGEVTTTSEFLSLADNWSTPSVSHGSRVNIVLPIINMGEETLTDVLVEPVMSNDVKEWPFAPDKTGYTQNFADMPGCPSKTYEEAFANRREVTYNFRAREDVLTGYYPLTFKVWYSKSGIRSKEPVELSVFVYCQGKPGAGRIGMSEDTNVSQPRIIVTGFQTKPKDVFAGETFQLTINVQNTSKDTDVNNCLFDLEAVEGGTEGAAGTTNSYAAFLPTSGSSSIYVERIPAGESRNLIIEMQAKADLSQKPYVVTVKMKYDTDLKADLTDEAKVSVPVKQEAKFDSGSPEIYPNYITVGEQANVMFQIFNTGKTTLYNVQVKFEGDSVEGGETFLGNLSPGATGNVDAMVTGAAPTGDGQIKAVVYYEDDAGNESSFDKELDLFVDDYYGDENMEEMYMDEYMDESSGGNGKVVGGIIAGIVAACAAVFGGRKLYQKRKAKKQEEEDLTYLEDDEEETDAAPESVERVVPEPVEGSDDQDETSGEDDANDVDSKEEDDA